MVADETGRSSSSRGQGGNVDGAELGKVVAKNGVKIVGIPNLAATVPTDASALYARNVLNFLALSLNAKTGDFNVPKDDEIIQATLVCENGQVVVATK
jgi:NAD(P) transhydrogenase subunit alpha